VYTGVKVVFGGVTEAQYATPSTSAINKSPKIC